MATQPPDVNAMTNDELDAYLATMNLADFYRDTEEPATTTVELPAYIPPTLTEKEQQIVLNEATERSLTREQKEKLKQADPASKVIIYKGAMESLLTTHPEAFVAYINTNLTEDMKSGKEETLMTFDPLMNPSQLVLPTHINNRVGERMETTDVYTYDKISIYRKNGDTLKIPPEMVINVTNVFNFCHNNWPADYPSIETFGLWYVIDMDTIFYPGNWKFNKYIFTQEAGVTKVAIRLVQKAVFDTWLQRYHHFVAEHVNFFNSKLVKNDVFAAYYVPAGNATQRTGIKRGLLKLNLSPVKTHMFAYYEFQHPWAYHLYYYCQKYQHTMVRDQEYATVYYVLDYLRSLPKETSTIPMKPWMKLNRIDDEEMCTEFKVRVIPPKYYDKKKCKGNVCYCYNPFLGDPLAFRKILDGPLLSYLRIASDCTDVSVKTDGTESVGLSIHISMESNMLCGVCKDNTSKCVCHLDASGPLRKRGVFFMGTRREYVILGKEEAQLEIDATLTVVHTKSLAGYTPKGRTTIILCVPDGMSVSNYDNESKRFSTEDLGIVKACSIPRVIYDNEKYTQPVRMREYYKFLSSMANDLKTTEETLSRKDVQQCSNLDINGVIQHTIAFFNRRASDPKHVKKNNLKRKVEHASKNHKKKKTSGLSQQVGFQQQNESGVHLPVLLPIPFVPANTTDMFLPRSPEGPPPNAEERMEE